MTPYHVQSEAGSVAITHAKDKTERFMARLKLYTFGIAMDEERFREMLISLFHGHYRGIGSVDEILVRPREAIRYCDRVRDALVDASEDEAYDLPDDVILRTLLNMRKQG